MMLFKQKILRQLAFWVLSTFIICMLLTLVLLWWRDPGMENFNKILPYTANALLTKPVGWIVLLVPFGVYQLIRYLFFSWKNHSRQVFAKRFSLIIILPVTLLLTGFSFSKWYTQSENFDYHWDSSYDNTQDTIKNRFASDGKQRGIHVFGWNHQVDDTVTQEILKTNAEWITLVPWADQKDYDSDQMAHALKAYPNFTERDSHYINKINEFKSRGFYIMLKPHIWIYEVSPGKWRSDIMPKTEKGWESWSSTYREFILHYARMGEICEIDLLCIGTELHRVAKEKPEFWTQLIRDVRSVYSGKITYAANWNEEIHDVPFWNDMDYIGIQAYFPLTQKTVPGVKELKKGWKKHLRGIEKISSEFNKPILFTEIGYKSTEDAAIEPWLWPDGPKGLYKKVSFETQANCYEAFFQTFWDKEWFAGVHFWEWQARKSRRKRYKDINFSPQKKPAENVMTKWFATPAK